jgi:hypothetical protein
MKKNNLFVMPEKIFGISSGLIKLFLPPLAMVIFVLTSMGWLILPKIEAAKLLKNSADTIKSQIKLIDEKRSYLLSVDQDQLKQNADYLSNAVLKEKNSYLLLGVMKDICAKYDYTITSFSLSIDDLKGEKDSLQVANKDIATKMPLSIEVIGPADKFIDFIKAIENNLPILFIDGLENNQQGRNYTLKMTISSYYLADKLDSVSENLTINDLKLTKEESELLAKISQFEKSLSLEGVDTDGGVFVEYNRTNPF